MTVRPVQAAANALFVFEAIAMEQPVGVSQLSRSTGLDKSLVQRLLLTLHASGWIMPASGTPRRWQISSKPLSLIRRTRPLHLLELATAEMASLRDEVNETVVLAAPQRGSMVVIDIARSATPLRLEVHEAFAFSRSSAATVAFLAALPPEQEADFLELGRDEDLARRVATARKRNYAVLESGDLVVFGAALLDEVQFPFATLSVVVPRFRLRDGERQKYAELVAASARRCSAPPSDVAPKPTAREML